jgi:hypothetical protein
VLLPAFHGGYSVVTVAIIAGMAAPAALSLLPVVRRQVALRVDDQGILLGGGVRSEWVLPGPAVLIPWHDVEEVVVYRGRGNFGVNVGVRRYKHVSGLARKAGGRLDRPAKDCPVPGVTVGTSRWVAGWSLDQKKLAAAVAAVAPAIPVVDLRASADVVSTEK